MDYFMGIDGGGSQVRVAIVTRALVLCGSATGGAANPNSAGRAAAAQTIQAAVQAALAAAQLSPQQITAVGAGIAGTMTAGDWVRETVALVLPHTPIRVASDFEIALVGAQGERRGVLILAGTGSVIYGVNAAGESAQVGGWGYLLGDEGSGYWLGLQALQAVVRAADGRAAPTRLTDVLLDALKLPTPQALIQWIYAPTRTQDIARLAPLVLSTANDPVAQQIITAGVGELAQAAQTVVRRLHMAAPAYHFAGGLLSEANPLNLGLCAALGLATLPVPKHPPVIGAALLAQHIE